MNAFGEMGSPCLLPAVTLNHRLRAEASVNKYCRFRLLIQYLYVYETDHLSAYPIGSYDCP